MYEIALSRFFEQFLSATNNEATCIDVGANIGCHTLAMAKYAKLVIAYEPIPFVFDLLKKSICENSLKNVYAHNCGLSNRNKNSEINIGLNGNVGGSSIHFKEDENSFRKLLISLEIADESLLKYNLERVDLVKIDVEGHEAEVILGMQRTIKKHRPIIVLEWNCAKTTRDFDNHGLLNKLFSDYAASVILTNHENIYRKIRKIPVINWFRYFLKTFLRKFSYAKVMMVDFDYTENYQQNVILIPNEKIGLVERSIAP